MAEKVTELRRPPFWDGLKDLMQRLKVPWEDLYPDPLPEKPTFLGIRNTLFHSHTRIEDEVIAKETVRLKTVVDRIILRHLGHKELWMVPPPNVRHFVAGQSLPRSSTIARLTPKPRSSRIRKRR